jgi:signal transduction histidine kinase
MFLLFLPVVLLSSTNLNIAGFDSQECIAFENSLLSNYILGLKIFLSLWMVTLIIKSFRRSDLISKKKLLVLAVGILSFIFSFLISGLIAGVTENYILEMYGLVAIIVFIISLARLVLVYGEFNIKVFSAQLLVLGLIAGIGSQFAFIKNPINYFLNSITVLISILFGAYLIRSVKKEVAQREKIERLAKDLENANEKLKELDQMKSEFLSLATHQIRAPLTAIKGYSSMLLEGDFGILPPKAKDSIETIYKSCQNLINIVGDFLNISRIEQGRMIYEKSIFNLGDLIQEVTNEIKPNIESAGLKIEINLTESNIKVDADRGKIKQVIGNLIDNAIKYTVKGSINVKLYSEKGEAKIEIKDTGVGIDPHEMDKLFNKFSRTKDANKTNVIGTGLGLYIAKKMIEAHHGDIKVFSAGTGQGTTFTIELPKYN